MQSRLTKAGLSLLAKEQAGQALPNVTRVMAGAGYTAPDLLDKQADISEPIAEMDVGERQLVDGTIVRLPVQLSNLALTENALIRQIGVFSEDPDEGEILYQIVQYDVPYALPAHENNSGGVVLFDQELDLRFAGGDAVSTPVTPGFLVTRNQLSEHNLDETAHPAILHIIEELAGEGIGAHNTDDSAHPDIRTEMARKANQADVYDKATVDSKIANATPPTATGSSKGIVQLSDAVNSSSNANGGIAATPAAVKSAYDLAGTANNTANTANTTANNANTNANGRAPTSHAVNAGTYGLGNAGVYGHVKLSDTFNSNPGAAAAGIGASGQAVYNAWVVANTANNTANAAKQSTAYATSAGSAVVSTKLSDTQGGFTVGVGYGIVQLGTGLSPGLVLSSYASQILINNGSIIPVSNGTADLGMSANRFRGIYLASNPSVSSDKRLKTNIQKVDSHTALGIMEALDGSEFDKRNTLESDEFSTKAFGFIAQDVQEAFAANGIDLTGENHTLLSIPESPESDTYGIQYEQLIPILWQAVKGLSHRVEQLEQALALQGKGNTTKQRKRGNANA